ncbi:MAG TPA: DUF3108 domain-containing protein [Gemmatimonadaceae bacterium]|nr:DUF3108 domain-containing protein [Gemmatimonadaceae bacterium]
MTASALLELAIAGSLSITISASAQTSTAPGPAPAAAVSVAPADSQMAVPFAVGETAEYDVKFGALKVGTASTVVKGIEQVRGISAWHTVFSLKGGTFFYHVDDVFESWIDRSTFSSLRFYQTQQEGSSDRQKRYEIYPDRGRYMEMDKKPPRDHEGVKDPLDDGSFLFFVRTLPLEVGHTYESNRYFRPERNPIRVRVLRKETIDVPAGRFDCVVLQPVIKTQGIFSENGNAEVWLSDDSRHVLVQLKSKLSFGSINLYLRSYKAGS